VITLPEQRWSRCDIKSISLRPNILGAQLAKENGAEESLFIRDGALTEGSRSNCAAVVDGQFYTYPQSNLILGGITRDAVIQLCHDLKIPVCERPVLETNLKQVNELMLLGTTTEVMPVVRVNDWQVADGKPGPVTRRLQAAFKDLVAREAAK
jgi:D-alanine transaminase